MFRYGFDLQDRVFEADGVAHVAVPVALVMLCDESMAAAALQLAREAARAANY